MAARKSKKDRLPKRRPPRTGGHNLPPGLKVVRDMPGQLKMSEVMQEFIGPYRQFAPDEAASRKLMMMAMIAWNAALMPEEIRSGKINEILEACLGATHDETFRLARQLVDEMVARKLEDFAAIHRSVISFELTDRKHDFHLSVVSTPEPPPH